MNYVMIPYEIIYNKHIGDKRVIIFSYLCSRRALDDTVAFSINELCQWSGVKPNYREGKINEKYLFVLKELSGLDYFVDTPDFDKMLKSKYNSNYYQLIHLNINKFDALDRFGIITFDELDKIINFKKKLEWSSIDINKMSAAYILLLLSYLRLNMNRYDDEKPKCCYRLYKKITNDIGLSERYIVRILEILEYLEIIKYKEMKREKYIDSYGKERYITTPKVFANHTMYIKKDGHIFIDESYNADDEINKQIEILQNQYKNKRLEA